MISVYECGLCKENEKFKMTRRSLRAHLKKEHKHRKELFNNPITLKGRNGIALAKHNWIIKKEVFK